MNQPAAVIADLSRNPVYAWHWIPDQVRDDKTGVRDDKFGFKVRVRYWADSGGSQ